MQKLMIVKAISIFMGICIIGCMISIVVLVGRRLPSAHKTEKAMQHIDLPIIEKGEIKDFKLLNGNIYVLISAEDKDEIVVIKEENAKTIMSINLNKGAHNE